MSPSSAVRAASRTVCPSRQRPPVRRNVSSTTRFVRYSPCARSSDRSEDRKRVEDVGSVIPRDSVHMEEGRVDLAPELEAALGIPDERRAVVVAVLGKCLQIPRGIGEFQNPREEPVANPYRWRPRAQTSRTPLGEAQEAAAW